MTQLLLKDPRSLTQYIGMNKEYCGRPAYYFHLVGRRSTNLTASVLNDVAEFLPGQFLPTFTSADALEIVSSSANDAAGGTGVRKVVVTYLSASDVITQSAEITLNGLTPVAAGFTAKAIYWMESVDQGSGELAAGNITLRLVSGATVIEQITAGGNKSLSARFQVPLGWTGYMLGWDASCKNQPFDCRVRAQVDSFTRALTVPYHFVDMVDLSAGQEGVYDGFMLEIPGGAGFKCSVKPAAITGSPSVEVGFDLIIIKDTP